MAQAKRKGRRKVSAPAWAKVPGSRISNAEAGLIGETLATFYTKHRRAMKREELVALARDPKSKLHELFEWDDAKAADAHRLQRASYLLGSIVVEWEKTPGVKITTKGAYAKGDGSGYTPARVVFRNVDMTKELLVQARRELASWHARFKAIRDAAELVGVFEAIEAVIPEATGKAA
jgi:hypothetical protein